MDRVPAKSRAKSIAAGPRVAGGALRWSDDSVPTLPKWIAIALVIAVGDWRESRALRHTVSLVILVVGLAVFAGTDWVSYLIFGPVMAASYLYAYWRATRGNFRRPFERRPD